MAKVEFVKKRNGRLADFNVDKINQCALRACEGVEGVSASEVVLGAEVEMYNKIPTKEIDQALISSARSMIYKEPNYSNVATRLLFNNLYKEVFKEGVECEVFELQYQKAFIQSIKALVKAEILKPEMVSRFDLKELSSTLKPERDDLFEYIGAQALYDRYLLKVDNQRKETPQGFFMRVAMGLSLNEDDPTAAAKAFYELYSTHRLFPSTPTLFNSGTIRSQLSSCFLSTVDDSINGIFENLWQQARLSKHAGGLGNDLTPLRAANSYIKGTNGKSNGIVPWAKVLESMLIAVNQGGKRRGSGVAYLEPWHADIFEFIDLRKEGDYRVRAHELNIALWANDLFLEAAENDSSWYLFCPSECPTLHDTYGDEFRTEYEKCVERGHAGELKVFKEVSAKDLWKRMLGCLFETGHPWMTFKDPCNMRSPQQHDGVIHSSNLCTEITLNTKASRYSERDKEEVGETAVCNLCSVNLKAHLNPDGTLNYALLRETVFLAVRGLDNVIDLNFYPTHEAEKSSKKHRPVGLGCMGFADVLFAQKVPYSSDLAVDIASEIQEYIAFHAIRASIELAKERGKYETFEGSLWSQGILPMDTFVRTQKERFGVDAKVHFKDTSQLISGGKMRPEPVRFEEDLLISNGRDWGGVRRRVMEEGMRNSNVMAIAPTASISSLAGCEPSIEPSYSMLFVYETMSGNFTIPNRWFVQDMKERGIWSTEFAEALRACDGDVMMLDLPDDVKQLYLRAADQDQFKLIDAGVARQKWIDQSQSLNLYNNKTSLKFLNDIYMHAWKSGLKTTYYLRGESATKIQKVSNEKVVEEVPVEPVESATPEPEQTISCSILDPDCESCQ